MFSKSIPLHKNVCDHLETKCGVEDRDRVCQRSNKWIWSWLSSKRRKLHKSFLNNSLILTKHRLQLLQQTIAQNHIIMTVPTTLYYRSCQFFIWISDTVHIQDLVHSTVHISWRIRSYFTWNLTNTNKTNILSLSFGGTDRLGVSLQQQRSHQSILSKLRHLSEIIILDQQPT